MRENAHTKATRYLGEGRLVIRELDEDAGVVQADVRGAGAVWTCGHDSTGWFCDCPARTDQCAHLVAVRLVVALEPRKAS